MGTILNGMRHVQWHELRHASGSASQVPGMLSRIAWGDTESAEDALSDLGQWIGAMAVFDSTVATVPFLWELAATKTVKDRVGVLGLLRTILAQGHMQHAEWTRDAHLAVVAGRATAERLAGAGEHTPGADDGDPAVREAARELLAAIDGHVCETSPRD
jgi:hypothetical protein